MDYEPLSGIQRKYYIEITPSASLQPPYGGNLVVSGQNGGGTSDHCRFVYTLSRLYIDKENASAKIALRKNGNRIEVVDLH